METTPPPPAPPPKRNWWSRNWKWFVPTGCLTLMLLFALFVGAIVVMVFSVMKSSDVYKEALAKAKAEPAVIEALGSPVEDGWMVSGSTHASGPTGDADLAVPLSGPKGRGTLYVVAKKVAGEWSYTVLAVELSDTKERIDLLHESE